MATNVYLPEKDQRPSHYGFRWCTKDCRWESKTVFKPEEAQTLAEHFGATVEVKRETHFREFIPRKI